MASPSSFGLGGSANHSLRNVGLAEPGQEVDRPIASQGIEVNRRSLCELPVPQKPHIGAQRGARMARAVRTITMAMEAKFEIRYRRMRTLKPTFDRRNPIVPKRTCPYNAEYGNRRIRYIIHWPHQAHKPFDQRPTRVPNRKFDRITIPKFDRKCIRRFVIDRIIEFDLVN